MSSHFAASDRGFFQRLSLATDTRRSRTAAPLAPVAVGILYTVNMIMPTTWVQSATVGSITTIAVLFPRLRGWTTQRFLPVFDPILTAQRN
jgi:hypothetical protein